MEKKGSRKQHPGAGEAETVLIPPSLAGMRLDRALGKIFPAHSRARLQQWLREGRVLVEGVAGQAQRAPVRGGETVTLWPDERVGGDAAWRPGSTVAPFQVVHEDADLIIVDKPAGLVVHPGSGNPDGTLINRLLADFPELAALPRAGIVHRLDKDTSGLLVVARSPRAREALTVQLKARTMGREYEAVVDGVMSGGGIIDVPIGRHPVARTRMAVDTGGRPARTHYRVIARYQAHTHVSVRLETGRTHQVRVHLAHARHPIVGDPLYGRRRLPAGVPPALRETIGSFGRQALHAVRLTLKHPADGTVRSFEAALPADMQALLGQLERDGGQHRFLG